MRDGANRVANGGVLAPLQVRRFENIIAFESKRGLVGFHARNLQVAHLDPSIWQALAAPGDLTGDSPNDALAEVAAEVRLWNDEVDPSVSNAELPQAIRSFTINVSQLCNLKCSYCAAGGDGTYGSKVKEVDLESVYEQLQMLLHDVPKGGRFTITFLGGEPLVYPKSIAAIARFAKLQAAGRGITIRFDIVTNGTLINLENAKLLASLGANVTISLDGPAEVNDRQRPTAGGHGSTERTLRGLEALRPLRSQLGSLSVGSVFGPHNVDVIGTYEYLRSLDFDFYKFDFAAGAGDGASSLAYAQAVATLADLAWSRGGETELRKINLFDDYFRILDGRKRILNHCGAGKSLLQVDTSGKLTTCQWFVGDDAENVGHGTRLDHSKLSTYADPLVEKNGCGSCWARHLCGGGCMYVHKLKTGSKHRPDPDYCHRTKHIIGKAIELYAQSRQQKHEGE